MSCRVIEHLYASLLLHLKYLLLLDTSRFALFVYRDGVAIPLIISILGLLFHLVWPVDQIRGLCVLLVDIFHIHGLLLGSILHVVDVIIFRIHVFGSIMEKTP